jgi:vancomycin resistance protein VanJ
VSGWIGGLSEGVVVAGDFNMPTDSAIYRECWSNLSNAFSKSGFGFGYTEWPTVGGWRFGIRIDHILTGPRWRPQRCWVGPDVGSDHLPLLADVLAQ